MSEDGYLNYGKLITDSHTGEILITCKSNKNAKQITSLLNMQQARIEMLEKGILDCLFNNKSIGILAEEMGLVE